jgi:hypothetical protein
VRELPVDQVATEIAITSRFNLLFQWLCDYIGDISQSHILCRIAALSEIIGTSKWKIIRTLDSVFV